MERFVEHRESCDIDGGGIESEQSSEYDIALAGFALVRSDFADFSDDEIELAAGDVCVIRHNGSRPWCIVRPLSGTDAREILSEISNEKYMVHELTLRLGELPTATTLADVRNVLRTIFPRSYDDYSIYTGGEDQINLVMNNGHLTLVEARNFLDLIEKI